MKAFDVAVIGLGAMGSAALFNLAKRGRRVIGFEQFEPGHDKGSSHGESRAIRLSYFEHPSYVPLARRAYEVWRELEQASGETILTVTGKAHRIVLEVKDEKFLSGSAPVALGERPRGVVQLTAPGGKTVQGRLN